MIIKKGRIREYFSGSAVNDGESMLVFTAVNFD